jgi:NADPH-dependent 2,4-dienoyl-CoA reductase/sulfur reductase-like enzyme
MTTIAIVGAGPAGLRAAEQIVAAGLRPVLIDEAPRIGGQVYRQPPPALQRPPKALYGFAAPRALALFERWNALRPQVDHRPETLVWQIEGRTLHLLQQGRPETLPFDALLLATGATDRVLPFPGWTLPGVFTLGAAQVLLKAQATRIGPRVAFAGTGPLLYLVAWQYLQAGGTVQAVLDAAPPDAPRRALPALLASRPALALQGALLLARLRAAGVPVRRGVRLLRAEGDGRVQRLHWQAPGAPERITDCDAVAFGHGLRSETQLADLAGCAFEWDAVDEAWAPSCDAQGRSSVAGVYLAGDGAAIRGADAAESAGARAAQALLQDLGRAGAQPASPSPPSHEGWRHAIKTLAPLPADWAAQAPDELIVCRCEEISAGELRACVRDTGTQELNRLKALTRIGMGRCQGRICGAAAARLLTHAAGVPLAEAGRLRTQPPVKPVPIAALAMTAPPAAPVPAEERDD